MISRRPCSTPPSLPCPLASSARELIKCIKKVGLRQRGEGGRAHFRVSRAIEMELDTLPSLFDTLPPLLDTLPPTPWTCCVCHAFVLPCLAVSCRVLSWLNLHLATFNDRHCHCQHCLVHRAVALSFFFWGQFQAAVCSGNLPALLFNLTPFRTGRQAGARSSLAQFKLKLLSQTRHGT